ncbi:MAG: sensor histidine kinase [Gaiellales bacterium]
MSDLNQVFLNLVVNAAQAITDVTPDGERGRLAVRTRCEGDEVVIEIEDTGGGIPDEHQSRVFEPFFTTGEVGKGSGQGLALARSVVVDRHHGTLTFETEPGVGTTFVIRLPIDQGDCSERRAA